MQLNPQTVTDKWVRRGQAAGADFTEGVKGVSVSPTELAAAKTDKALQNYTESVTSGRMRRNLLKITRESWIKSTVEKGATRFVQGFAAGKDKMLAHMTDFLPYADNVRAEISKMPDVSFEDAKARMLRAIDLLHDYKNRR
jgi:hypothetical protein